MRLFGDEVGSESRQTVLDLGGSNLGHILRLRITQMVEGMFETAMVIPDNIFEGFDVARRLDFGERSVLRNRKIFIVEVRLIEDVEVVFILARNEGQNVANRARGNLRVDEVHSLMIALSLWNNVFGTSALR